MSLPSAALDALAVILTEATDLVDEPSNAAANKVATILQAARELERVLGNDRACSFVTHTTNGLVDRYQSARASFDA